MRQDSKRLGPVLALILVLGGSVMQLLGCGGGPAAVPQADATAGRQPVAGGAPGGQQGLPALPIDPPAVRVPSYSTVVYSDGNAIFDSSPGCLFSGDSIVMTSTPGELAYALYAFNTGGYEPQKLEVGLGTGNGSTAWVGVANYVTNTWEFFGPFTSLATINLNNFGYLSGGGQFYALVAAYDGSTVTSNYLVLTYDNAIDTDYSIAGTVVDEHGAPIGGALVRIDPEFTEVATDAQGHYYLPCMAAGDYTVTPSSLDDYLFNPVNTPVTVDGHETGVDFTGSRVDVQGRITTAEGAGVAGVQLTLEPGARTALSGADGSFEIRNVMPGDYTVAPILAGYTFEPLGRNITVAAADFTGADFTATGGAPTWAIRGTVALASSVGVAGVSLILTPGYRMATTDANGDYAFYELGDGVYHVDPAFGFYTFAPAQATVIVGGSSVNNVDFTATPPPPTYTVSGVLKDKIYGDPLPGVEVRVFKNSIQIKTALTDINGAYAFTVPDGTYLVYAYKNYYEMSSPFVTVAGANKTVNLQGHMPNGATWNSFANSFISNNCIQCHRPDSISAVDPPLRDYDEVKAAGSACNFRVQNGTMPPDWSVPVVYKKYFQEWKDNGYPEN